MTFISIPKALTQFSESAVAHAIATEQGDYKTANKHYEQIVKAAGFLKKEGQLETLKTLFTHENHGIQIWAATYALSVLEEEALETLENIARLNVKHHSFTARTTLKEWRNHRLNPKF